MNFIERRPDTFGGPRPMDVDKQETEQPTHHQHHWWGGADAYYQEEPVEYRHEVEDWQEESSPEISHAVLLGERKRIGVRGNRPRLWEVFLGEKGGKKGWPKGKAKGKGKSGFQGECHWCGQWGHSASRCRQKEYMGNLRRKW